jgi:hypothetical protein
VKRDGNKYEIENEKGTHLRRRFRANEMRKYSGVEPFDNSKDEARIKQRARTVRRMRKEGIEPSIPRDPPPIRVARTVIEAARDKSKADRANAAVRLEQRRAEQLKSLIDQTVGRDDMIPKKFASLNKLSKGD